MYLLNSVGYVHSFTILQTTPHTAMYVTYYTVTKDHNRNVIFMSIAESWFLFVYVAPIHLLMCHKQSA